MSYSLSALGTATGQTTKSLSAAKGNTTGPIAMSSFFVTGVSSISGYTYIVENTSETYELTFTGEASNFDRIKAVSTNFSWAVTSGTYIIISGTPNYLCTVTAQNMNPEAPNTQTTLMLEQPNTLCVTFADGYNTTATNYNTQLCKTVYSVDSYDGNAADLCLLSDSPILKSNGDIVKIGDIIEGDKLVGFKIEGIPTDNNFNYLGWSSENLKIEPTEVSVVNVIYSFTDKYYSINNGEINATLEHPMLVYDKIAKEYRFKRMLELSIGDKLIKETNNNFDEIEISNIEIIEDTLEVVTIDVEDEDTYLVNGYVTHNKGGNTHTDYSPPATPTGLAYAYPNLTWNTVTGAASYYLQVSTNSSFSALVIDTSTGTATSWNVSSLSAGTYYARVKAVAHGLSSSWSTTLTFDSCSSVLIGQLGYSPSSSTTSCGNTGTGPTMYGDTSNFTTVTVLYSDGSCTIASTGYYSNGTTWRYWNGSIFTSSGSCPTPTPTITPTITRTPTYTPTLTPTLTRTPTYTPTRTPTRTPTLTPTKTITPTITITPTATVTPTYTITPTPPPPLLIADTPSMYRGGWLQVSGYYTHAVFCSTSNHVTNLDTNISLTNASVTITISSLYIYNNTSSDRRFYDSSLSFSSNYSNSCTVTYVNSADNDGLPGFKVPANSGIAFNVSATFTNLTLSLAKSQTTSPEYLVPPEVSFNISYASGTTKYPTDMTGMGLYYYSP